jgi:hypothetical protein
MRTSGGGFKARIELGHGPSQHHEIGPGLEPGSLLARSSRIGASTRRLLLLSKPMTLACRSDELLRIHAIDGSPTED